MPGMDATVLVIWEPASLDATRMSTGAWEFSAPTTTGPDASLEQAALDTTSDGVQRATAAGFVAQPRIVEWQDDIAAAILAVADDIDADVIVLGTRGLGNVKSLILGSVSKAVVHHADRPVLVIPSRAPAEQPHQRADHI